MHQASKIEEICMQDAIHAKPKAKFICSIRTFFSSKIVERGLLIVSEHMANSNSSCTNAHYMSPLQTKKSGGMGILSLHSESFP